MRTIAYQDVVKAARELCLNTYFTLRDDVRRALEELLPLEEEPSRGYLQLLLDNAEVAQREQVPLHNDTGELSFFVEMGADVWVEGGALSAALREGVQEAFQDLPIRSFHYTEPLVADTEEVQQQEAAVHLETSDGEALKLTCVRSGSHEMRGFRLFTLQPPFSPEELETAILQLVEEVGGVIEAPLVIGVGLGGSLADVGTLARRALFRPVGKPHHVLEYARIEQGLLDAINNLRIGPGQLGGKTTALAVHVEARPSVRAALPIAIVIQSYAIRIAEHTF